MKSLTGICLVLFLSLNSEKIIGQGYTEEKVRDSLDYSLGIELPSFVGGDTALEEYIRKNFVYSKYIKDEGVIAGTFRVSFTVDKEGKVTTDSLVAVDFMTGLAMMINPYGTGHRGKAFQNHLLEILESSPNWTPGQYNGEAVPVRMMMDIYVNSGVKSDPKKVKIINNLSQLALDKKKGNYFYNKAVNYSDEGNFPEAIHNFTLALQYNPKDIDALYNRGILKYKSKDDAGACADWYSIKSLGKTDADELLKKYCETK